MRMRMKRRETIETEAAVGRGAGVAAEAGGVPRRCSESGSERRRRRVTAEGRRKMRRRALPRGERRLAERRVEGPMEKG